MEGLQVIEVYKSFGEKQALAGVSFEQAQGEIMAILGPSGCGKSTLLNLIAGLQDPDSGDIRWQGQSLQGVPPYQRGFGLMFQDFALFPHRNVYQNVAFGLEMAHTPKNEERQRVRGVLALVDLAGYEQRDVNTLSGGEQQRVALARALAPRPKLLMLDEPLGSVDRTLRERLVLDLRQILRGSRQTALYVTHDQQEAFGLADRVVVMNAGRVEQIGRPGEIYRWPATPFVARFLGLNNLVAGRVQAGRVETPIGAFPAGRAALTDGSPVTVLLRPDAVQLGGSEPGRLEGKLVEAVLRGQFYQAVVEVQGVALTFYFATSINLPPAGTAVELSFNPEEAIQVFPGSEIL